MEKNLALLELLEIAREISLQKLKDCQLTIDKLKKEGDESSIEKIKNEVIPSYEKIFLAMDNTIKDFFSNLYIDTKRINLVDIENFIKDLLIKNKFDKIQIKEQIVQRKNLKSNSASIVVKNLYKYKLDEFKKIKFKLEDKIKFLTKREEKLSSALADAIQEQEQIKIVEKLLPLRENYSKIEENLRECETNIKLLEDILEKRWHYEIYGTTHKDDLKKIFYDVFSK